MFILHSETNLPNPFFNLQKFRTDSVFYVFDLSKQRPAKASQPNRLEIEFSAAFDVAHYVAYAIVLAPKLISISSDGERHSDLL